MSDCDPRATPKTCRGYTTHCCLASITRVARQRHGWCGIISARPFDTDQVQPASLDLRLGDVAYRIRSSFLPGPEHTVADRIEKLKLHELDLTRGAVLERGCVYLVPLQESLDLPETVSAGANPKSSTGRLDVFTRVIGDRARGFDVLPAGYTGPLFLEISPRTFPVRVPGSTIGLTKATLPRHVRPGW